MSNPTPEPFPTPGATGWAGQLEQAIETRDQIIRDLADGRITPQQLQTALADYTPTDELMSTYASKASEPVVDTTVGTRVMVGGVMIYGDTGWRVTDGPTIGANITAGTIRWRRIGNQVHAFLVGVTLAAYNASILSSGEIPNGFQPDSQTRLTQGIGESKDALSEHHIAIYSALRYSKTITTSGMHTNGPATDLQGHLSWLSAYNGWPTVLPGTPA